MTSLQVIWAPPNQKSWLHLWCLTTSRLPPNHCQIVLKGLLTSHFLKKSVFVTIKHGSWVRYASIFAKKCGIRFWSKYGYGTLVRCLNVRTKRTNVPCHTSTLSRDVCNLLTTLRIALVLVWCIWRVCKLFRTCSDFCLFASLPSLSQELRPKGFL